MISQRVHNIVNRPRLARLGVVRLGIKGPSGKTQEVDHFILDIPDRRLQEKARALYGDRPKTLDITSYTDDINEVFRCTYQKWGRSNKGTSYLVCEGNGIEAYDFEGKHHNCPCNHLGRGCKKTTVLKFLIPKLSMGGYFILATRSENNAQVIGTTLPIVCRATGGLIMRPLKLVRTAGYAEVNGIKVKKYFVSLLWEGSIEESASSQKRVSAIDYNIPPIEHNADSPQPSWLNRIKNTEMIQRERGRVRGKIKLHIKHSFAEKALEVYACRKYNVASFDDLGVEKLLELWHSIDKDKSVVFEIYKIASNRA